MKIKKVKWKDHPILGDLELDFANGAGVPYQNILLAGENGTGKTSILKSINGFLNGQPLGNIEYLEYVINSDVYKVTPVVRVVVPAGSPQHQTPIGINDYSVQKPDGSIEHMVSRTALPGVNISTNPIDARYYGSIFSKARADYQTQQITSVTTQTLDIKKYDVDGDENFSPLKQLLVDIESQDNEEYTAKNKALGSSGLFYDVYYPDSKVYRFKNAFDSFFENIKYTGVSTGAQGKIIAFKKDTKSISIDDLSTGEKQIVFRGVFLLRNSKNLQDANIFIDEPELSMHPKWQRKILQYYTQLFTSNGVQSAQMFFATHSEHVLKEGLENGTKNLVIALFPEVGGVISARRIDAPKVLPIITYAETNYLAFNMVTNDYHIELYGYLQEKLNLNVKDTDSFIQQQNLFYNSTSHEKDYINGSTMYKTLPTYIRNCIHHPDARSFNEDELRSSIELLVQIIPTIP